MSDIAIKVEDVGKLYRLGEVGTGTLSQDLKRWWAITRGNEDPFAKIGETNDRTQKGDSDYVWALKNISFEVKQGEVLGIIGRNGAGKSTLLKLLSKVTTPSTGNIKVKGRIASLLEVGTGFHPELTGRENVFLNGAILGMTKKEIKKKFDEIVDFSGVERYIDTPVKRYSSGMYVRLAFAVAAFLEPEILIIDEVLAVGDAEFQKKCLGRMKDVSVNDGRTVLFVSHNMQAISTLCTHGIYMKNGMGLPKTSATEAVAHYSQQLGTRNSNIFPIVRDQIIIHDFRLHQNGKTLSDYEGGLPIDVFIDFELNENLNKFRIGFFIKNLYGEILNRSLLADWDNEFSTLNKGRYSIQGIIPAYLLVAGSYAIEVHSSRYGIVDYRTDEPSSTMISILPPFDYNQAYIGENIYGSIVIKQNWEFQNV
jgi:lipopolysaccharide transport system ATP-binding protein